MQDHRALGRWSGLRVSARLGGQLLAFALTSGAAPSVAVVGAPSDHLQAPRRQVLSFTEGTSLGDPCEARAYHGFNGLEDQVVTAIARWILGG